MYRFNVDAYMYVNNRKLKRIKVLTTFADSGYTISLKVPLASYGKNWASLSGGILRYVLPLRTNLYLVPMFQNCAARTTMLDMVIEKPSK